MRPIKWTPESCAKEALKYNTRKAFEESSPSAYSASARLGILKDVCYHMKRLIKASRHWENLENCKKDAINYTGRFEWQKLSGGSYRAALKNGWMNECCSHMEKKGSRKFRALYAFEHPDKSVYVGLTYNYNERYNYHMTRNPTIISKYKKGGQVFKKFNIFYDSQIVGEKEAELIEAYRNDGWTILNKNKAGGLGSSAKKWSLEKCMLEALKYSSKKEWEKKSNGSYQFATRNGHINLCCLHMVPYRKPDGYWTLELCKKDALNFSYRGEWALSSSSYQSAQKNGWLDICCEHMPKNKSSKKETTYDLY